MGRIGKKPALPINKEAVTKVLGRHIDVDTSDPWQLARDILSPGVHRRRLRFTMAHQHMTAVNELNKKEIANRIGTTAKYLSYYIGADEAHSNVPTTAQRIVLAKLVCGDAACEPWLSHGHWQAPDGSSIIPQWLKELRLAEPFQAASHWMALAHLRLIASGYGGDADVLRHAAMATPWSLLDRTWYKSRASAESCRGFGGSTQLPLSMYLGLVPELAASNEISGPFARVIKTLKEDEKTHRSLWEFYPSQVQRAMRLVPVTTREQRERWRSYLEAMPLLLAGVSEK